NRAEVWVFDIAGPSITKPVVEPHRLVILDHPIFCKPFNRYLVEISNALFIVTRSFGEKEKTNPDAPNGIGCYYTAKFKVYQLDVSKSTLNEVITLGESSVFLGRSGSMSIDSSRFTGVKPNRIYFIDDMMDQYRFCEGGGGGRDMGAYNLEDGSFESFYPGLSLSPICRPTWITPSF
ncbi:probable F-box protein At1g65740, partial [Lycium barbarum]|uniref:probable F-box protein At1g65740 n=1 Tax=Lycium barbarum TaxID=112863 RepID=UPI00293E405C